MEYLLKGNAALALASAIIWGGGDFSGGVAVKAAGGSMRAAFRVVLLSHTVSLLILLAVSLLWGGARPSGVSVSWGLVAGLLAALSLTTFYVALSGGAMGAAAALSGLLAAAIPAAVSSVNEGLPGTLRLAGFAVAGVAIWLVAAGATPSPTDEAEPLRQHETADRRAMTFAIAAGVGFGLYFIAMKMAGREGLLWPMTSVRVGSFATCAVLVLATLRRSEASATQTSAYLPRRAVLWAMGPAFLDTGGNLLFMAATRMGRLDVASVLASLYPASTILLAAWMFHERPTRRQGLGMLVAAAAVVMISL